MTNYLTLVEVLAMHADQVRRYGGTDGVRDLGLVEAALYRPKTGYYTDVIAEAAALWESLSQNHPFVDANKRTAFACMFTFLRMNGLAVHVDAEQATAEIPGWYEAHNFSFEKLESWLRANVRAV